MGIIFSNAALLLRARQAGADFSRLLTIGHQQLYIPPHRLHRLARRFRPEIDPSSLAADVYADRFFNEFLGARSVQSLDVSNYEGSELIHDLNQPIGPNLHGQFDAIIDGGSLEHIFNFPVAIANCMQMVRPGGRLFLFTMANNHAGHGFYQFSPELFYRVLSPENGFQVEELILEQHDYPGAELSLRTRCYRVTDPATVRTRVGLVSSKPVMMMVQALRTAERPLFAAPPIQSDYTARYASPGPAAAPVSRARQVARWLKQRLPLSLRHRLDGRRQLWHYAFSNRTFYEPWDPLGDT